MYNTTMPYANKEIERVRRRELRQELKEKNPDLYQKRLTRSRAYQDKYRLNNPIPLEDRRIYLKRHIERIGIDEFRKERNKYSALRRKNPWIKTYDSIYSRLRRSKNLDKWGNGYRCYVGIEMHMTPDDLKMLWERDGAASMQQPSIDRKDSKGNYTAENCQYIEMKANRAKVLHPGPMKRTLKID